jgi:hypothetical protein
MKFIAATLILLVLITSCKKNPIEQAKENYVLGIMTNGKWKVTSFVKGSADVTTNFAPYSFQFKNDLTVDAINNGNVEKTGTWNADPNALTITSTFTNANATLTLLNGTWYITNTTTTSVQAREPVNGEVWLLSLQKL